MTQAVFEGAGRQSLCLLLVEARVAQLTGHQRQGALPVSLRGKAAVKVASAQLFQRPGQIIHIGLLCRGVASC